MIVAAIVFVAVFMRIRDGIITIATKGLTTANAFCSEPRAFDCAVFFKGFKGIGATGGLKTAGIADPRGKQQAVGAHRKGDDMGCEFHDLPECSFDNA